MQLYYFPHRPPEPSKVGWKRFRYKGILTHHKVDSVKFRHELYETLAIGRRKGNAFMIVGGKDTGKTTITNPIEMIFQTMTTPQSDSFCPLESIRDFEVLLWQDFRYNPGHPKKDEQGVRLDIGTWNRLLEGLPTRIGVPKTDGSRTDFTYDGNAPLVATGPFEPTGYKDGVANETETKQLTCRCKFTRFEFPAPEKLNRDLKDCPHCWSRWLIHGEILWRRACDQQLDDFLSKAASFFEPAAATNSFPLQVLPCVEDSVDEEGEALLREEVAAAPRPLLPPRSSSDASSNLFDKLSELVAWRKEGLLSETQFEKAKSKLGL